MRLILIFIIITVSACATYTGLDPKSLKAAPYSYFNLPIEYPPGSYQIKTAFGKLMQSPNRICKGNYIAKARDNHGTYFSRIQDCYKEEFEGGIYIPDNPSTHKYDLWLIVKDLSKEEKKELGMSGLVAVFNDMEVGNYRRFGLTITDKSLIDSIDIQYNKSKDKF